VAVLLLPFTSGSVAPAVGVATERKAASGSVAVATHVGLERATADACVAYAAGDVHKRIITEGDIAVL
jgi:hypothetical protein